MLLEVMDIEDNGVSFRKVFELNQGVKLTSQDYLKKLEKEELLELIKKNRIEMDENENLTMANGGGRTWKSKN